MKFFIEKIFFQNRSPFDLLDVDLSGSEIAVLTAANGRGKTTILSHIVDAFHELAKGHFPGSFEGKENKFYRVSSRMDMLDYNQPSIFYMRANLDGKVVDYVNIVGVMSELEYKDLMIENKMAYEGFSHSLSENGSVKHWGVSKAEAEAIFNKNIVTYFPAYRFEVPGYINDPYAVNLSFRTKSGFRGRLSNPLEVVSGLNTFANWLMDIVLDMQYESSGVADIKQLLDNIVTLILQGKSSARLRFGIGPRGFGDTRVQIVDSDTRKGVYPSIFHMSAGEAAALCLAGEIVRQADVVSGGSSVGDVSGVVLVDEIDKHLHIRLQKEVLPKLLSLFPNVQFIVSSHSPFMAMGLADEALSRSKIIDLDNFGITRDPFNSELYSEVYEMMVGDSFKFREQYLKLKSVTDESRRTLIVTEGKTDVSHMKAAAKALGCGEALSYFEVPADWGDSKLEKLLEQISKLRQGCTVIGMFDRDVSKVVADIEKDGRAFKSYGNNVYGFCLPIPLGREDYIHISIEFYYSDSELKKQHDGKRLYFDNEVYLYQSAGANRNRLMPKFRDEPDVSEEYTKKIFDNDVSHLVGAHSKAKFAELVENNVEFSKELDFSKFKAIFERILKIEEYESGTCHGLWPVSV